ncbi:hypothetical protein CR513_42826, partial [Mucuna pruriens]
MEALENKTWELVSLPKGKKLVDCNWVYTVKVKANGSIERYKTRLVAKVSLKPMGFAPVAKIIIVRVILSLAANYGWELQQFDVKNAFLHEELEEEIYMEVTLVQTKSKRPHSTSEGVTVLLVYANDIIVTGDDWMEQQFLSQHLTKEFEIKTFGRLKYFLGIEVSHLKKAYTNADYAKSVIDRKSTTRYCTFLEGNLVTWRSKKHNAVARSSAEAEFRAMAQIKWDGPMKLYWDNKSAIKIAYNPVQHD